MKKKRELGASRDPDGLRNTIIFNVGGNHPNEMLRITPSGFFVRGVKVEQDDREAEIVYNSFRDFLTYAALTRNYQ